MIRYFWRNFFFFLVVLIAFAQWACASWLASQLFGVQIPWQAHLLGPALIYVLNRLVLGPRRAARPSALSVAPLRRAYMSVAFTSIFGFAFLLVAGAVWGTAYAGVTIFSAFGPNLPTAPMTEAAALISTAGLVCVLGTMAYGYGLGQRRLFVNEFDLELADLPAEADGLRLVQISDIHLGQYLSEERLRGYVEKVNSLSPDIVCITGDITDGLDHAERTFPILAGLRARHGVYAILGNHDMYTGAEGVTEAIRLRTDFTVLRDEVVRVQIDGGNLFLIGLEDRGSDWAHGLKDHPTLEYLFAQVPQGQAHVLLSHRPDPFEHAARLQIGLTLAGHTHGGQLALPWFHDRRPSLAHFITAYPRGTFQIGRSTMHVNLGLGVTGQPVRLATPREITVVTLRQEGEIPT